MKYRTPSAWRAAFPRGAQREEALELSTQSRVAPARFSGNSGVCRLFTAVADDMAAERNEEPTLSVDNFSNPVTKLYLGRKIRAEAPNCQVIRMSVSCPQNPYIWGTNKHRKGRTAATLNA
jgi:hypothetical protein